MEREIVNFGVSSLKLKLTHLVGDKPEYRGMHIHNEIEIVWVRCGALECFFENESVSVLKGNILFINKRAAHRLVPGNSLTEFSYLQIDMDSYIKSSYFENYSPVFMYNHAQPYKIYESSAELAGILYDIERELSEKKPCYEEYLKADIYRISAFMFRNGFLNKCFNSTKNAKKLLPSIKYLEENYKSDISLEDISGISGIDKFYFCRLFKQVTGLTYIEYLNHLRLAHSEELLIGANMNILEVALECGFNSIQYFNRVFKREKGCTPKQFKLRSRQIT